MSEIAEPPSERRGRRPGSSSRPVAVRILAAVGIASVTAIGVGALAVSDLHDLRDARAEELSTALPYMNSLHDIGPDREGHRQRRARLPAHRPTPSS